MKLWLCFFILLGFVGAPFSWDDSGDRVHLSYTENIFSASSLSEAQVRLGAAVGNLKEMIARLRPAEIEDPSVFFYPEGPRGCPQFEIRGTVRVLHVPLQTYLKGDISESAAACATPWSETGYRLEMTFIDSPDWIKQSAAAVSGLICLKPEDANPKSFVVSFDAEMIEGPDFSAVTGKKLTRLLALQPERILEAIHETLGSEKSGRERAIFVGQEHAFIGSDWAMKLSPLF